jgi:hypothetical protein
MSKYDTPWLECEIPTKDIYVKPTIIIIEDNVTMNMSLDEYNIIKMVWNGSCVNRKTTKNRYVKKVDRPNPVIIKRKITIRTKSDSSAKSPSSSSP